MAGPKETQSHPWLFGSFRSLVPTSHKWKSRIICISYLRIRYFISSRRIIWSQSECIENQSMRFIRFLKVSMELRSMRRVDWERVAKCVVGDESTHMSNGRLSDNI